MFGSLGRFAHRYRWPVIGAWLLIVALGTVVGGRLFDQLGSTDALSPGAESMRAERRIDEVAPEGPLVFAVVSGRDVYDPGLVNNITKKADDLRAVPDVVEVRHLYEGHGAQIGSDNLSTTVWVELAAGLGEERRGQVEDQVRAVLETIEAPSVLVGGTTLAERAFVEQSARDLVVGEAIAFALLLVALVIVFGGVVAGSLPLAVAFAAVTATLLGLLGLTSVTTVSPYTVNVVTLLGIGLAVDYSLLIVARYREQLAAGDEPAEAIEASTTRAGRTVAISGLTVAAAFGGLALFAEPLLASMALGGVVVVVLATLAALTLVPALLAVAGERVPPAGAQTRVTVAVAAARRAVADLVRPVAAALLHRVAPGRGRAPSPGTGRVAARWAGGRRPSRTQGASRPANLLGRLAAFAQGRPAPVALGVTAGLLLLAAPFLWANLQNSDARALPHSNEVRQAHDALQLKFANSLAAPVTVVAEVDPGAAPLRQYLNELNRRPEVFRLALRPDVAAGVTVIDLTPEGATGGPTSRDLVRALRAMDAPFAVLVGGEAAEAVDYQQSLARRLPVVAAVLLLATGLLLFALTGSLLVPVKALLLSLLTLFATLGILVVLFQWGWGGPLLFFDPWGGLDLTTPVLLFVFVFGLSMDYEVFLLARIKEEYDRTGDNDRAVLAGICRSGPVVTAAATCIGIVFLGFAVGGLVAVKEIGVGMAVAILLDVTVLRGLLLPATMTLFGSWNWWAPAPLRRLHARLGRSPRTTTPRV